MKLLTNATNEVEDVLYEDYEEEKIEVGYIPTLEEGTKSMNVDEDVSGTAFAPPPPPSSNLEFMVPPPVYVSPRNKLKASSSFNLPPPPEYAEDLPPPPTFGFEVPPAEIGAPPTTVELPPPPPPSLPSFGSLPPPPEEVKTQEAEPKRRRMPSKSALPPAPMSWDDNRQGRQTRSKSNIPSPRNWDHQISDTNGSDDDDSPPALPKALSLDKLMETNPSPPPVPAVPPHQTYGMSSYSVKGLDLSEDNEVCFLELLEAGINKNAFVLCVNKEINIYMCV